MPIELDQDILRSLVHYDPESGVFTWLKREETDRFVKAWNARYAGKKVTSINGHGYIQISIKTGGVKKRYEAHRLAWLYVYGYLPTQIDHKNRVKTNNWISNLREASTSLNCHNVSLTKRNASGVKGVNWHKASNKWIVRIARDGKVVYLGTYDDLEEAKNVYSSASISYAKEFSIFSGVAA